jgi:signal transduction histidine kinase
MIKALFNYLYINNLKLDEMIKIKLLLVSILFSTPFFSQKNYKDTLFFSSIIENSNKLKLNKDFQKASLFFYKKEWDSTLIYTARHLNETNLIYESADYCHFYRGYSFLKKKIFKEAQKEFLLVSLRFNYNNVVKMKLGEVALEQSQFEKAISYFEALNGLDENKLIFIKKNVLINNLALCYHHLKQFNKAEPYFIESIKINEKNNDTIKLIGVYGNFANFYYEQYKDNLAIPYFEKAYFLAKQTKSFHLKRKTAKNMAVVEENKKNYKKALVYRKEAAQWKDSLNNQNKIYEVAQIEKNFAVKEKQKEVDILQVQNKLKETQRTLYLYIAIALLVLLGIGGYFYREKTRKNKIIALQKENLDLLNATKDKLFSIVSHDLRSSVNALKTSNSSLIDNLESKNIEALPKLLQSNSAIVNGAYGLLDNLLNWALLQTEQSYFSIEEIRLFVITEHVAYNYKHLLSEKELHFENAVSKKDLVFADQESIKIVLRNLIDNAIKFSNLKGSIKIYSRNSSDDYCDLIIEDTGLGMSDANRLKLLDDSNLLAKKEHEDIIGTGLGLQLCKSMIAKNNGKFTIESELGKGTKMIVSLPKKHRNG